MSFRHALAAELRKTATLPAAFVAAAVTTLGSTGITVLNAFAVRHALESGQTGLVAYTSPVEAAFSAAPLGTVGAVILGVTAFSSEYTANSSGAGGGRQVTATLAAVPRRLRLLAAKVVTVLLLVASTAAIALPASLVLAYAVIGDAPAAPDRLGDTVARSLGAALYWALTGLLALAITALTRSGIVPLIVLIVNSSLVSVSLLLTKLTPVARYLPDLAGVRLFGRDFTGIVDPLGPFTGGLVMTAWAAGLLAIAGAVLTRRDA